MAEYFRVRLPIDLRAPLAKVAAAHDREVAGEVRAALAAHARRELAKLERAAQRDRDGVTR